MDNAGEFVELLGGDFVATAADGGDKVESEVTQAEFIENRAIQILNL